MYRFFLFFLIFIATRKGLQRGSSSFFLKPIFSSFFRHFQQRIFRSMLAHCVGTGPQLCMIACMYIYRKYFKFLIRWYFYIFVLEQISQCTLVLKMLPCKNGYKQLPSLHASAAHFYMPCRNLYSFPILTICLIVQNF